MDSKLGEERPGGRVVAARTKKQASFKFIMTKFIMTKFIMTNLL